jgi:4'-phosphopantetheinyl transferase
VVRPDDWWSAVTASIVRIWVIPTEVPRSVVASLHAVLDEGERCRAGDIAQENERRRFVVAHAATRLIVGDMLGVPAGRLRFDTGPNGKPRLARPWSGLHTNLSHSGALCLLAAADRELGVDVQEIPPAVAAGALAVRYFPPAEARFVTADPAGAAERFVRLWARKEACLKAAGGKLMQGMGLPVRGPRRLLVHQPGAALPGPFLVTDLRVPAGYRAAVAVCGTEPYRVVRHRWRPGGPAP